MIENIEDYYEIIDSHKDRISELFSINKDEIILKEDHRLVEDNHGLFFKSGQYFYSFLVFDPGQYEFYKKIEKLKELELKYKINFDLNLSDFDFKLSEEAWLDLKKAFLEKFKSDLMVDFEIREDIIQTKKMDLTPLTMENFNKDKYVSFITRLFEEQKSESIIWLPDDIFETIMIKPDGNYIIVDFNRFGPYFLKNLNYYFSTRWIQDTKIIRVKQIRSKLIDEIIIKEIDKLTNNREIEIINLVTPSDSLKSIFNGE